MNIFFLDINILLCAKWHCDSHCVKMILEYSQLLSTAHRVLDGEMVIQKTKNNRNIKRWIHPDPEKNELLYKSTHINHPSAAWVRESHSNYLWLYMLFRQLSKEYTIRYNKVHKSYEKLGIMLSSIPKNIKYAPFECPPLCMPDECKLIHEDPIEMATSSYKKFYIEKKSRFAKWTVREPPEWYQVSQTDPLSPQLSEE